MLRTTSTITRRRFVGSAAAVVGAALTGTLPACAARGRPAGHRVPIGVQLYSVRHELAEDLDGTIARLAAIGFEGVEFADYFGRSAGELRALLDRNGLACCGTHIYLEDLEGERFAETVEFSRTLDNQYLIVRWIPEEQRASRAVFMQAVDRFNTAAERLAPHGMRVGYHSHGFIFERFDDETLWDVLARNTREDVVLQLDSGPAAAAGKQVAELIRRHPGRTATMHVKAHSAAEPAAPVGADEIDWPAVVEAAETVGGIEWYILEYEIEGVPPLPALEASFAYFRGLVGRT